MDSVAVLLSRGVDGFGCPYSSGTLCDVIWLDILSIFVITISI
jgi:hypothetical protein